MPDLVIDIIWSFHEDMKAKVCINGELLAEDINVESGLRQGCKPSYCISLTRSSSEGPPGMLARVN